MVAGDMPTFRIFDSSANLYYSAEAYEDIPWADQTHPIIPSLNGVGQRGCMDNLACNYNGDATSDDGSCYTPCQNGGSCSGDSASYVCSCEIGWEGNICEIDIDECALGIDLCDEDATCTNIPGSYTCACNSGFSGNGFSCIDIDECAENTDNCHEHANCTNNTGSFSCSCVTGYIGDGITCVDFNECLDPDDNNCDENAYCTNKGPLEGFFSCTCNAGFETPDGVEPGVECVDVTQCGNTDLCYEGLPGPEDDAICDDTSGPGKPS
jgi:hypothetical protein